MNKMSKFTNVLFSAREYFITKVSILIVMENKHQSKCFDEALNKFLNYIESLWTSLPIVLKTVEHTKKKCRI